MVDKKIKVEADITTKNNVSSGIGKGFGMVIGIFLALIVIAVSCSILISSNAKKIEEKSNEITANAKDRKEDKFRIQEEIKFDIFGLGVGEHVTKKAITNIGFNDLDLPKKIKNN